MANLPETQQLCLSCGLCCNGVIFADVQLQASDDAAKLRSLGLLFKTHPAGSRLKDTSTGKTASAIQKLPQPCAALDGCHCRIYPNRPTYCRKFECALLKNVKSSSVSFPEAQRLIRSARHRADKVRRLLRELGDHEESLALSRRFRRIKKRLESSPVDEAIGDTYGELTLAVHELNVIISHSFYPGTAA